MTALQRASAAWRWIVCIWLGEIVIAALGSYGIRSQIAAAMDEHVIPDDRLLYATAELVHIHPELVISIVVTLATSTLLGFVLWTLLAPLVMLRLASETASPTLASLGGAWLGRLGGAVATSAWHLAMRVLLVVVGGQAIASLPGAIAVPLVLVIVLAATCALDMSRAAVLLGGARGASPRVALDGFTALWHNRKRALAMAALAAGQWLLVAAGLVAVVRTGGESLALMRACAAAATFFGVFRLALAVTADPARPRTTADET